jgi:polyisoprenoid-binding protein YceI
MKYLISVIIALVLFSGNVFSQKYLTKNGKISFYSETTMEKIAAVNTTVNAALDVATTDMVFKVLIKSFEFEKALMQEHFNENYMESDKFPTASYKGKITNISEINFAKTGTYKANTEGEITIHGVTKTIKEVGTISINGTKVTINAKFNLLLKDFGIKIPNTVVNNISESIQITVESVLEKVI